MADEPSSGGGESGGTGLASFKAILTKKYGGIPVWAMGLVAIAVLAYILHKRAASKPTEKKTDTSGDVTSQTFPYAQPMNYTSDVFVNTPKTPVTPTPAPTPTNVTVAPQPKKTLTVMRGWQPINVIRDMNAHGYNIDYASLVAANPGLEANIDWNPTDKINFFKGTQTYVIPEGSLPKTEQAKQAAIAFLGGVS